MKHYEQIIVEQIYCYIRQVGLGRGKYSCCTESRVNYVSVHVSKANIWQQLTRKKASNFPSIAALEVHIEKNYTRVIDQNCANHLI